VNNRYSRPLKTVLQALESVTTPDVKAKVFHHVVVIPEGVEIVVTSQFAAIT